MVGDLQLIVLLAAPIGAARVQTSEKCDIRSDEAECEKERVYNVLSIFIMKPHIFLLVA